MAGGENQNEKIIFVFIGYIVFIEGRSNLPITGMARVLQANFESLKLSWWEPGSYSVTTSGMGCDGKLKKT